MSGRRSRPYLGTSAVVESTEMTTSPPTLIYSDWSMACVAEASGIWLLAQQRTSRYIIVPIGTRLDILRIYHAPDQYTTIASSYLSTR